MQTEPTTDKLNVPTNVLDVPMDLVRIKSGGGTAPLPPFGYANVKSTSYDSHGRKQTIYYLACD